MRINALLLASLAVAAPACAQSNGDPFPNPISSNGGEIVVDFVEFATLPESNSAAARMMVLVPERGTQRLFVNDMRGPIYSVSYDGETVVEYVDTNLARWGFSVLSRGRERGMQSFAFHPQFGEAGAAGYGKFYTWTDTDGTDPAPDFVPVGEGDAHDTVLLEWTANEAGAATYDGGPPREVFRFQQPYGNHNGGQIGFNTSVSAGDSDFGLLYVGVGDGGSGGDPQNMAQNLSSGFGKILRIDPLGSNGSNGEYGIPADNPFAADGNDSTLGEIFAYGLRNPQRFAWDSETGDMFVADIGQSIVEELSPVTLGANLGWNTWEGSFRYEGRSGVGVEDPRSDPSMTYPLSEYDQRDDLLQSQAAAIGLVVYRGDEIPALSDMILWGDNPSGEVFYLPIGDTSEGGQANVRRVLFNHDGETKTLLELVREKNVEQGKDAAGRVDMRISSGPSDEIFILNKYDGVIRRLVPGGGGG